MGNMCCQEPEKPRRYRQQIVPNSAHAHSNQKYNSNDRNNLDEQKILLHDFSYAIGHLKNNFDQNNHINYKGVYTHNSISSDQIS